MATACPPNPLKVTATSGGGSYDLCPAANHPGVLVAIIDLGTHTDKTKDGKTQDVRKLALFWELPGEIKPDGDPFVLGKEFILSFDGKPNFGERSGLRLLVEGWFNKRFEDGQEFDLEKLAGRAGLINVVHDTTAKGKTVHQIESVKPIPKGMTVPKPHHAPLVYITDMGEPPDLDWLPYLFGRKAADVIHASKEFGGPAGGAKPNANGHAAPQPVGAAAADDDIPF